MSGPSGTYPQRAYRNPLDEIVKFFDYKHKDNWAIWEFRAEGTGYPDEEVYGRVWHYPWPDHHPPPFRLIPNIMASMRNWLREDGQDRKDRVVLVHCKAGKGRSGTIISSFLISECGWKASEALARFTERRMRPGFGQGVSIPSQLRWVGYVDRWTQNGKIYGERQIEILEVHVWGLRDGVKVAVEGYVEEGKVIKVFHVFGRKERVVVDGGSPGGFAGMISDMFQNEDSVPGTGLDDSCESKIKANQERAKTVGDVSSDDKKDKKESTGSEAGGKAVIFRPASRIVLPTSDINIDFERRNMATYGWTMVTSVAHVWFNAYFEGHGPEKHGKPDDTGVFEMEWDKMDGIKGSARKGTRAFDRFAVVWKAVPDPSADVIREPGVDSPVEQVAAADWKGQNHEAPGIGKDLGLRTESPRGSANPSKANSFRSNKGKKEADDAGSVEGVKASGPDGGEDIDSDVVKNLPQPTAQAPEHGLKDFNAGLDTASKTTPDPLSTKSNKS